LFVINSRFSVGREGQAALQARRFRNRSRLLGRKLVNLLPDQQLTSQANPTHQGTDNKCADLGGRDTSGLVLLSAHEIPKSVWHGNFPSSDKREIGSIHY
jgi:hypothetical protein